MRKISVIYIRSKRLSNALILSMAFLISACALPPSAVRHDGRQGARTLNPYVLRAVALLNERYAGMGYANESFTHDVVFGRDGVLTASEKPFTMCVAAQLEVFVEALNLEAQDSGNYRAFSYMPKSSWQRIRPSDFRGQIWIVTGSKGHGMPDALNTFGMGEKHSFDQLRPGDFINFNRVTGTGHGAVFLGYLKMDGEDVAAFGESVVGFKYFSSQGKGLKGGLGIRYAFFSPFCPRAFTDGKKRDCGVVRSESMGQFVGGSAWTPADWSLPRAVHVTEDQNLDERDGTFNSAYFSGATTDE